VKWLFKFKFREIDFPYPPGGSVEELIGATASCVIGRWGLQLVKFNPDLNFESWTTMVRSSENPRPPRKGFSFGL
jgi:hypothetical protein